MITYPEVKHTVEGRKEALFYCENLKTLASEQTYTYKLWHFYDDTPTPIYVRTYIEPPVFELLLAHLLFEASEINDHYALGQEELSPIFEQLYGIEIVTDSSDSNRSFDLYYTWEKWTGLYDDVQSLKIFKHDKLRDMLKEIVPKGD